MILLQVESTTTDWIQAVSSVLACLGLTITLLLQWKTLDDQRKILSLEGEKDRRSIMPILKLNVFIDTDESNQITSKQMILTVTRNPLYRIFIITSEGPDWFRSTFVGDSLGRDFDIGNTIGFIYETNGDLPKMFAEDILRIKFEDMDGRMYNQTVTSNGIESKISLPTFIGYTKNMKEEYLKKNPLRRAAKRIS